MVNFLTMPQCRYMSNLKERSKDNSRGTNQPVYMTESMLPAINFEKVRNDYCRLNGNIQGVGAVDAATMLTQQATLVEFKNGVLVLNDAEIKHLHNQVKGSIEVMKKYLNLTDEIIAEEVDFILDFNLDKNNVPVGGVSPSSIELILHIVSRGNRSIPLFGMDAYIGVFKNVYTMPKEQFNELVAGL